MWTDPPYGVDYEGKTEQRLRIVGDSPSETIEWAGQGIESTDRRDVSLKEFAEATPELFLGGALPDGYSRSCEIEGPELTRRAKAPCISRR
jgi:hypothetical protein